MCVWAKKRLGSEAKPFDSKAAQGGRALRAARQTAKQPSGRRPAKRREPFSAPRMLARTPAVKPKQPLLPDDTGQKAGRNKKISFFSIGRPKAQDRRLPRPDLGCRIERRMRMDAACELRKTGARRTRRPEGPLRRQDATREPQRAASSRAKKGGGPAHEQPIQGRGALPGAQNRGGKAKKGRPESRPSPIQSSPKAGALNAQGRGAWRFSP